MKQWDVFISHANEDQQVVDAIAVACEGRGIRCWYAARDILPGSNYPAQIMAAIKGASVMVLVLSKSANASEHVKNELERAIHHGLHIVPFRIEATEPAADLEYLVARKHWLDALPPPAQDHVVRLAETIGRILERPGRVSQESGGAPVVHAEGEPSARRKAPMVAALLTALFVCVSLFSWFELGGHRESHGARTALSAVESSDVPESRDPIDDARAAALPFVKSEHPGAMEQESEASEHGVEKPTEGSHVMRRQGNEASPSPVPIAADKDVRVDPRPPTGGHDPAVETDASSGVTARAAIPERTGESEKHPAMHVGKEPANLVSPVEGHVGFGHGESKTWVFQAEVDGRVQFTVENLIPRGTEFGVIRSVTVDGA
ncbi:MAG TPA: toll/interleukin-1 receptor domain-containing protein, partial [Planctomycetes bacterium]|nr:toll/interleukin-1 receptor domain-containing protein [Planctomycetota bacterium]